MIPPATMTSRRPPAARWFVQLSLLCACVAVFGCCSATDSTCIDICVSQSTPAADDCVNKCETLLWIEGQWPAVNAAAGGQEQESEQEEKADESAAKFWEPDQKVEVEEEKRAPSSFIRIGRQFRRTYFGKRDLSDYVRMLKAPGAKVSQQARYGSKPSSQNSPDKRASSFVRIGRRPTNKNHKRYSSFVRIGRTIFPSGDNMDSSEQEEYTPRLSGKRLSPELIRFGKGLNTESEMAGEQHRLEQLGDENSLINKRASSFVRIGRRAP